MATDNDAEIAVTINGERRHVPAPCSVAALLKDLKITGAYIAVAINDVVVPRSQHVVQTLQAGDDVLIVHPVGGG